MTVDELREIFSHNYRKLTNMAASHFPYLPPEAREDAAATAVGLAWTMRVFP